MFKLETIIVFLMGFPIYRRIGLAITPYTGNLNSALLLVFSQSLYFHITATEIKG